MLRIRDYSPEHSGPHPLALKSKLRKMLRNCSPLTHSHSLEWKIKPAYKTKELYRKRCYGRLAGKHIFLFAGFTYLFIYFNSAGDETHIHTRSSSHWGKLSKTDTSVSSVTADSSRKLVRLFSSPSSTPGTRVLALLRACAPPAWRHEHVGLQSLESAPELGTSQSQAILASCRNYRRGAINKMRSTAGSSHGPSAPSYP